MSKTKINSLIHLVIDKLQSRHEHLSVILDGKDVKLDKGIYIKSNRIYLPLYSFMKALGIDSNYKGCTITVNTTRYISIIDIVNRWNLKTVWDYSTETIYLYRSKEKVERSIFAVDKGTALIRLEDVTAGPPYDTSDAKEKLRLIGDYLYSMSIPFHIAWIPRYVNPPENIDNDISRDYSISNADFLFTLDYLISRGGIVGLHGYTHQYGDEVSGDGTEFSSGRNEDEKSIRKRVESAIKAADMLNIYYKFFESPHYASTEFQQSIMEQYFDFIYEPYVGIWGDELIKSPRNNRTIYVPTPLGYISGLFGPLAMLIKINMLGEGQLASFFYHPYREMDYIILRKGKDGYPGYTYLKTSILHKLTDALLKKGYEFRNITTLKV